MSDTTESTTYIEGGEVRLVASLHDVNGALIGGAIRLVVLAPNTSASFVNATTTVDDLCVGIVPLTVPGLWRYRFESLEAPYAVYEGMFFVARRTVPAGVGGPGGGTVDAVGAITGTSLAVTGAATVGTMLGVTGTSTLASLAVTGAATVGTMPIVPSVTSIAALRLISGGQPTAIYVEGYYARGDGGEGMFFLSTSVAADNGGTIIVDAAARRWGRAIDGNLSVKAFGAKGDGSQNASPAILAAITAAVGRTVHFPVGQYLMNSAITYSGVVNILGDGNGAGPGSAEQDNTNCSQLFLNFANPSAFIITTNKPCSFRSISFMVNTPYRPAGSGAAIKVSATAAAGATNANTRIENCAFNWFYEGIVAVSPAWWTIRDCYFGDWTQNAINSGTIATVEGSLGYVENNFFFGRPDSTQSSCILLRNGYSIISRNEILGAQYGVRIECQTFPMGFLKIIDNTIEENFYGGVLVTALDANDMTMLDISGNEFSAVLTQASYLGSIHIADGQARKWLQDVTITRNISRHVGACALGVIRCGAGQNMIISDNIYENIGGGAATLGIGVSGTASNEALGIDVKVFDNLFKGTVTTRYSFAAFDSASALLRDESDMTFTQIPSFAKNGSILYISDGRGTALGNYTVQGGGNGVMAFRQRGAWLTAGDLL